MNIFVINKDPMICAKALDDKRLNKMLLETVQLLSNCGYAPYKHTHTNHPCSKWVKESKVNTQWTINYLLCLASEYSTRFDKLHLSYLKFCEHLRLAPMIYDIVEHAYPNNFCNCSMYKDETDVFKAYQKTLADKWDTDKIRPKWYGVEK